MSKTGRNHSILDGFNQADHSVVDRRRRKATGPDRQGKHADDRRRGACGAAADLLARLGSSSPFGRNAGVLDIDLVNGLSNDESGTRYVATAFERIDGIVTVRHHLAPLAKKAGPDVRGAPVPPGRPRRRARAWRHRQEQAGRGRAACRALRFCSGGVLCEFADPLYRRRVDSHTQTVAGDPAPRGARPSARAT